MPCRASFTEPTVLGFTSEINTPARVSSKSLPNHSGAWLAISPARAFNSSRNRPRLFQPSDNLVPTLPAVKALIAAARVHNVKVTLPVQSTPAINADPCQLAGAKVEGLKAN